MDDNGNGNEADTMGDDDDEDDDDDGLDAVMVLSGDDDVISLLVRWLLS